MTRTGLGGDVDRLTISPTAITAPTTPNRPQRSHRRFRDQFTNSSLRAFGESHDDEAG